MKKKYLRPLLFVAPVLFLIAAFEERVIDGGPIHYNMIGLAVTFFGSAVAVLVATGRKSDGGSGPPNS